MLRRYLLCGNHAVARHDRDLDGVPGRGSGKLHLPGERVGIPRFPGFDLIIVEAGSRAAGKQHITEDAVFTEHILAFEIRPIGIFKDNGDQLVFPFPQERLHIKFGGVMRTLAVAHILAVQINVEARDHAEEGQDRLIGQRFELEGFAVNAHGDIRRDLWRLAGELIALVDIKWRFIARALPIGRHLNPVERFCVGVERLRQFGCLVVIMEIPFP